MKTAIYCRVSTEDQKVEGSSLESQQQGCFAKAKVLDFQVVQVFSEVYSGLNLDRPELNKLRESVRNKEIDTVLIYCLDRLTRDPIHGSILQEEMGKFGVDLVAVAEDIDTSDLGKLISYIRTYSSKVEVEKIKDRTQRGRRARALGGKLPSANHARLYGFTYIAGKGVGEGIRYINESQAKWTREMYRWLIEEGLSVDKITYRLRALEATTPSGKGHWIRSTVLNILKNPAYCGKAYCNTMTYEETKHRLSPETMLRVYGYPEAKRKNSRAIRKPREEWIELPKTTPLIVSQEVWDTAQECLRHNRKMAKRNSKGEYLLSGRILCQRCGRAFWVQPGINSKGYRYPFYQCSGKLKRTTPIPCDNHQYNAKRLDEAVWEKVKRKLAEPELILAELENRQAEQQTNVWEKQLETVTLQLAHKEKQKDRAWRAYEVTGDEPKFTKDIKDIMSDIRELEAERNSLQNRIDSNEQLIVGGDNLKKACELVASNLKSLSFEDKRMAMEALQVRLFVDDEQINLYGAIPIPQEIVTTPSK